MSSTTGVLRPWPQFLSISSMSIPLSISETSYRITLNLPFFLPNYALLTLSIFLLTLLSRPLSLIFFLCIFAAFLYLLLHPRALLDYHLDHKTIYGLLLAMTFVALLWTNLWWKFFVAVMIGAAIVVVHGGFRAPEESIEDSPYGSLLSESPRGEYSSV